MTAPLPARDGVSPSYVWLPDGRWKTFLEFLVHRFADIDALTWIGRMEKGEVVDEDGIRVAPADSYRSGRKLYYYRELENETPIPFAETVLYQDDHLLV